MDVLAQPDVMDQLIIWRMNDPRFTTRETRVKGLPMQRQWTIEIRADFADPEKNEVITDLVKQAAVYLHANTALISDVQKPQIACWSDDFFKGHQEIAVHADTLGKAIAMHGDQVGGGKVSDELLQAAAEIAHEKSETEAK
jgi:hypothetical protein